MARKTIRADQQEVVFPKAQELYKADPSLFFKTVKEFATSARSVQLLNFNSPDSLLQLKSAN